MLEAQVDFEGADPLVAPDERCLFVFHADQGLLDLYSVKLSKNVPLRVGISNPGAKPSHLKNDIKLYRLLYAHPQPYKFSILCLHYH